MLLFIIICFELPSSASYHRYFNIKGSVRQDSLNYTVYKIDSINNYYIIYAKNGDRLFKIISPKSIKKHDMIMIGKAYKFNLHSLLSVNGHSIIPENQKNEMSGWRVDDSTTINFEGDSIRDLFYASNVKGLSFEKSNN